MADNNGNIIKKKRCKKHRCEEENTAWEIAYGDFMTSMMAFFLVMWLIAATNIKTRKIISYYFTHPGAINVSHGSSSNPSTGVFNIGSKTLIISPLPNSKPISSIKRINSPSKIITTSGNKEKQYATKEKEIKKLAQIMFNIKKSIYNNKELSVFKNQVRLRLIKEGLEIVIFDRNKKPMFTNGSSVLKPYAKKLLYLISKNLKDIPNPIVVEGYTSALRYKNQRFSNWNLSTMRANAARLALQKDGIAKERFFSVIGYGYAHPIPGTNPDNPTNRRIAIIIKKI